MIIAIDGPVGVGKSTVARAAAEKLGFLHIDTGAMYRVLAWRCLQDGKPPDDSDAMTELAEQTTIRFENSEKKLRVFCGETEVTEPIRDPEVTAIVSQVSAHPGLRDIVVKHQREMGRAGNVVMEGRDIGTVVFPDAEIKIYLDGDLDIRAQRRAQDFKASGVPYTVDDIKKSIAERDRKDKSRETSPLKVADGATILDTTKLTVDEVVARIVQFAQDRS